MVKFVVTKKQLLNCEKRLGSLRALAFGLIISVLGVVLSSLFFASPVYAEKSGLALAVEGGWVRAVPPVSKMTAAYFTVTNPSDKADTLLYVTTDAAKTSEMHTIVELASGAKEMQQVAHVSIKPKSKFEFKEGGYHVMLIGLEKPLKAGDQVAFDLVFQNAGKLRVMLPVQMGAGGASELSDSHEHHHH